MSRYPSPLEYEGLEYILSRLIREHEKQQGIKPEMGLIVHDMTIRTSDGLQCDPPSSRYYIVDNFGIKGIYLQDGITILIAYHLEPDSMELADETLPIYIDMQDFMDCESFDLDYLIEKMEEHR